MIEDKRMFDGNYHCAYCGKVFRTANQAEFIEHQENCVMKPSRSVQRRIAAQKGLPAPDFSAKDTPAMETIRAIIETEREISFKQTQQEIVSWASEACPHAEGATKYYKRVCDLCWQEKLREWGIK